MNASSPPTWDDLDVGHELPALRLTLSPAYIRQYAEAAHMPGARFFSDAAAREEGLPGQIAPGNLSLSLFARLLGTALADATIKRIGATFRVPVRPDHPLVVRGVVTEKHCTDHGDLIEVDLVIESADGDRWVTGTATLQIPTRP